MVLNLPGNTFERIPLNDYSISYGFDYQCVESAITLKLRINGVCTELVKKIALAIARDIGSASEAALTEREHPAATGACRDPIARLPLALNPSLSPSSIMEDTSSGDIASKEFARRHQQQSQGEHPGGLPRAHHRFSIKDGDTILQVENALFRVHSHFLVKHSAVLSDTLSLPKPSASDTSPPKGSTYGCIQLTGDSVLGWECLLGLFYPDDPCQPVSYTAEQWAAVILLANKYMMEGIEASALNRLRETKPALNNTDLVLLAQKVGSEELYQEALQSLANQNQIMSIGDAEKIGLKAFHAVMTSVTEQVYAGRMAQHPRPVEWHVRRW